MLLENIDIYITFGVLILVFIGFINGKIDPSIVAMLGLAVLVGTHILETSEMLSVFSNPAPIAVGCMFVLSASLERTGVVDNMGRSVSKLADKSPMLAICGIMLAVMVVSAFMNNTPVVVIMTPVVIALAGKINTSPSKLLIPLSYLTILGGNTSLLGTSTNLLVDGVAQTKGLQPFGIFEFTLPALCLAVVGIIYLLVIGRWLLPNRETMLSSVLAEENSKKKFLTEILIPEKSGLIGKTLSENKVLESKDYEVVDLIRDEVSLKSRIEEVIIKMHDKLIIKTHAGEILGLKDSDITLSESTELESENKKDEVEKVIMEGVVGPNSSFASQQIGALKLQENFDVKIIAVYREEENIRKDFEKIRLTFGDTLLVEGTGEGLKKLFDSKELINLTVPEEKPLRRRKAPLAILAIVAVMLIASFKIMPIAGIAFIMLMVLIVTGCVEADEAYKSIEWRILMLIFGMLGISIAMDKTGAGQLLVDTIIGTVQSMGLIEQYGPIVLLTIVYFLTSLLTEMVSNNAAAVLLTPIAIGIAYSMGFDPKPFTIAVMFGASASFATPIGYQTNTFVFNAGNYRFMDFVKIGLPLNILLWLTATFIIPMFFPF